MLYLSFNETISKPRTKHILFVHASFEQFTFYLTATAQQFARSYSGGPKTKLPSIFLKLTLYMTTLRKWLQLYNLPFLKMVLLNWHAMRNSIHKKHWKWQLSKKTCLRKLWTKKWRFRHCSSSKKKSKMSCVSSYKAFNGLLPLQIDWKGFSAESNLFTEAIVRGYCQKTWRLSYFWPRIVHFGTEKVCKKCSTGE